MLINIFLNVSYFDNSKLEGLLLCQWNNGTKISLYQLKSISEVLSSVVILSLYW